MNKYIQPQINALHLAVGTLERERRRKFAVGNAAYKSGVRGSVMKGDVTGQPFQWAEDDRRHYTEYSEAIRQLEDMIEILGEA